MTREEAIEILKANYPDACFGQLRDAVDTAITALKQPEIIRCKDCKWRVEHYDTDGNAPYWICKNWYGGTDADGFCYEGERREG